MEIRGRYFPSKVQQYSELFCVYPELHARGGSEDGKAGSLPFFLVIYLNTIIIPEKNKFLNRPLDLGGFMR